MANIINNLESINFKYIKDADNVSDEELNEQGYYRGYPCPHGHVIREKNNHWCYHCAIKIKSNICGFDLNYLHNDYKNKYYKLWQKIDVQGIHNCWEMDLKGLNAPKRVCFPSYRTFYSKQKSENVNAHKAIYQCAWGDVGSLSVTRVCGNPFCGNPLHMVSSWNKGHLPNSIQPFHIEFDAEKLMRIHTARSLNREQEVIQEKYKATITHPALVEAAPDYDEG